MREGRTEAEHRKKFQGEHGGQGCRSRQRARRNEFAGQIKDMRDRQSFLRKLEKQFNPLLCAGECMRILPDTCIGIENRCRCNRETEGVVFADDTDVVEREETTSTTAEKSAHAVCTRSNAAVMLSKQKAETIGLSHVIRSEYDRLICPSLRQVYDGRSGRSCMDVSLRRASIVPRIASSRMPKI